MQAITHASFLPQLSAIKTLWASLNVVADSKPAAAQRAIRAMAAAVATMVKAGGCSSSADTAMEIAMIALRSAFLPLGRSCRQSLAVQLLPYACRLVADVGEDSG
jgi:hypothetical protein